MITPPKNAEVHDWPTSKVWVEDGILFSVSKKKIRTMEDVKGVVKAFREMFDNKKVCAIIEVSNMPQMPKEIREYAAKELPKMIKAAAIISESALGKMVANLFFTIKTQPYPTRFFNDVDEAKKWLEQYKDS